MKASGIDDPASVQTVRARTALPLIDLNRLVGEARVQVSGYFYAVDFGPGVRPQRHMVGKDKRCTCPLGPDCPAVIAVSDYLKAGGERSPEPRLGFYPVAPAVCPICGSHAYYEKSLSSPKRGAGWICDTQGKSHYWLDRARILKEMFEKNPWRFPPVVVRSGVQLNAWDGIQPGDQVLYPGLLRADIG